MWYKRKMAMEAAAKGIKPEELEKPTDEVLYTLAIVSGLIQLHANYLDIKWDKMHESIPLQNVLSFTIEEHSIGPNRIRIATAQAATANINLGYGVSSAVGGGNHVYGCSATELPTAYKIRDYISNWTAKAPAPAVAPQPAPQVIEQKPSAADEIRKYKGLLDDGIISQEEFEAKKKQLLGL